MSKKSNASNGKKGSKEAMTGAHASGTQPRVSGAVVRPSKRAKSARAQSGGQQGVQPQEAGRKGASAAATAPGPGATGRERDPRLPPAGTALVKRARDGRTRCECTVEEADTRLVPGVEGRDRSHLLTRKSPGEGLADATVDGLPGDLPLALGQQRQLLGEGKGEALVPGGPPPIVPGLAGALEAGGQLLRILDSRQGPEPDERHPAALQVSLPTPTQPGDVVKLGLRVGGVAAGVVAVGDVVDRPAGRTLGGAARAAGDYLDVVHPDSWIVRGGQGTSWSRRCCQKSCVPEGLGQAREVPVWEWTSYFPGPRRPGKHWVPRRQSRSRGGSFIVWAPSIRSPALSTEVNARAGARLTTLSGVSSRSLFSPYPPKCGPRCGRLGQGRAGRGRSDPRAVQLGQHVQSTNPKPVDPSPCVECSGCKDGVPFVFCEHNGGHPWPRTRPRVCRRSSRGFSRSRPPR
jgi:hypothetical protein